MKKTPWHCVDEDRVATVSVSVWRTWLEKEKTEALREDGVHSGIKSEWEAIARLCDGSTLGGLRARGTDHSAERGVSAD